MTTDPRPGGAGDRAARLEALRQRAPEASGGSPRTAAGTSLRRGRRRHAATGARILGGGLSAAVTLGLMGAMAGGDGPAPAAPAPAAAGEAGQPVVVVLRAGRVGEPAVAAPTVRAAASAPLTSSRGS